MHKLVRVTRALLAVAAVTVAAAGSVHAQMTTGALRGRVSSDDGEMLAQTRVVATHEATGVRTETITDERGVYRLPALQVGRYRVRAMRIGYSVVETPIVVRLGETAPLDFLLEATAIEVTGVTVTAEATPMIDPTETGVLDLISDQQIDAIPVNGRNFQDLIALSPKVGVQIGDGSGGNFSLAGGRRGANLVQIDGAGTTGTFFGGEARGSDRIPFAFSIESVQEFQVVTNAFDVEFGFFSGGVINAVTKSGTNRFRGSLFGYFRDPGLTADDFFGREPTEFSSRQIGGTLSGPIIKNKLHFFLAVERQDRNEPIFALPNPSDTPDPSFQRAHPDSIQRMLDILDQVYGVSESGGRIQQTQDEWSVFGRIDWQINNQHRLTFRHNYTDLQQLGDRVSTDELIGNGGVFNNTGNSTVLELNSVFSANVWNQFRAQYATEPRPRDANNLFPQMEVNIVSDFGTSSTNLRGAECCNDPVLPNNLEETTIELTNNLHIRAGDHDLKFGAQFNYFDFENFFFFRAQGEYDFDNLADFEIGAADDYQRSLPNPGPDGIFFNEDDVNPIALYQTMELGFYAQDTYRASDKLAVTLGLRLDITRMLDTPPENDALQTALGLSTTNKPDDTNLSPRLSFAYDALGDGSTVVRGGVGLFFGRFPSVLYSNALLNTGQNSVSLFCDSEDPGPDQVWVDGVTRNYGDVPIPDFTAWDPDGDGVPNPELIPTACASGSAASAPRSDIVAFAEDFEYPRTWKLNLGLERALTNSIKVDFDFLYSTTSQNFYAPDMNLISSQFTSGIESRPVFCPADEISPSRGTCGFGDNDVSTSFDEVIMHTSDSESRTYQLSLSFEGRGRVFSWQAGYTYTNSKDNSSYSCCISTTGKFETPVSRGSNDLGDPGDEDTGSWGWSDFSRPHTFVFSGIANLPAGFSVSGIWRVTSGTPWTPVVDGDANGDGTFGNDRAFISTGLNFENPGDDDVLTALINANSCLQDNEGRIVRRNACRNPMYTQLDVRLRWRGQFYQNHGVEVVLDVFNVLNWLNSSWSRNIGVSQFGGDRELLVVEGFDDATNEYIYSVNESFGRTQDLTAFRTDQGQIQLGVKYSF